MLLWIIGAGSLLFGIIEYISAYFFDEYFFQIGIPIIRRIEHLPTRPDVIQINRVFKGKDGKFKFVSKDKCFFIRRLRIFHIHTPFRIRGIATWNVPYAESYAMIVGKLPLGVSIFFLSAVLIFFAGFIAVGDIRTLLLLSMAFLFMGPGSVLAEKVHFERMVTELRELLSEKHQNESLITSIGNSGSKDC